MDWYRAVVSRDARFDGVIFVGVTTTGIYCRPVCPARTPRRDRCVFFKRAAEAERAGFRACFRCRPELAPGSAAVDAASRLTIAAVRRLEEESFPSLSRREASSIEVLARELGVSSRHLRRVLGAELGVTPIELAQTKRVGLAKQLLADTTLPITEIAFASGFSSVRRFNALMRERFGRAPTQMRKERGVKSIHGDRDRITLRLDYRPPFDWDGVLSFLGGRAIPGVESVKDGAYRRTVRLEGKTGWISVRRHSSRSTLLCEVSLSLTPALLPLVARVRGLFDLDAQPQAIDEHLRGDRRLAPLVRQWPGMRVPGAFDGFEMAVRAIVGQQISVAGATTIAGRIATQHGTPIETPFPELRRLFPSADALSGDVGELPKARAGAIAALARSGIDLSAHADVERAAALLQALPGIGPWTSEYIAMRALRWPDAFPSGDLVVRTLLGANCVRIAEAWRPWRAYAVMHLWRSHADSRLRLRKHG